MTNDRAASSRCVPTPRSGRDAPRARATDPPVLVNVRGFFWRTHYSEDTEKLVLLIRSLPKIQRSAVAVWCAVVAWWRVRSSFVPGVARGRRARGERERREAFLGGGDPRDDDRRREHGREREHERGEHLARGWRWFDSGGVDLEPKRDV